MRKLFAVGIAAVVLSLLGAACSGAADSAADEPKEGFEVGNTFPHYRTFSAKTIDGDKITFKDQKGDLLFIDFWAAWCGPCREELPYIAIVQDKYVGDEFSIVGISLDKSLESLREMADDMGLAYPQICDKKGWQSEYATMFGIRSIPTNYLLNGDGVIIGKNLRGLALEAKVAKGLGHESPIVQYGEAMDLLQDSETPDIEKALKLLDKAIEGDPERSEFRFLAAQLLVATGDQEKAVKQFEAGLEHKDKLPVFMPALRAYVTLGHIKLDVGDEDAALAEIDKAIAAIDDLDEGQKEAYAAYVPQLEQLKQQWSSEEHTH